MVTVSGHLQKTFNSVELFVFHVFLNKKNLSILLHLKIYFILAAHFSVFKPD